MALATVGGAALGAVFGALLDGIIAALRTAIMFKGQLRNLRFTLELFEGVDEDVRNNSDIQFRQMQGLEKFRIQLNKGAQLVHKCSKVRPWNVVKKPMYTSKLLALDASLNTLLCVLSVHINSDVRARLIKLANQVDAINIVAQNQTTSLRVVPEPPPFTVGLDVQLPEVKMELLKEKASMLVLTGLGGWGKTTLAQELCQDEKIKEKFKDNIFFVIVKEKSNCGVVQELCQQAGLEDQAIAFTLLRGFLKEKGQCPLLLVLDDVTLRSESLLGKLGDFMKDAKIKMPNFKVLVTSRTQFPSVGRTYPMRPLEHGDALSLFHHSASGPDGSSYIPEDLAEKIVRLCKGIPLAIETIGRSVCNRPRETWEKRVHELSKGSSILDSEKYLLACLKSSLDALDERMTIVKECFIDLGSFPEGRKIPDVALIDIWAELRGQDEDSWSIANVHELTARNLANLQTRNEVELGGYYSEHFVTQHDVLRALAIYQAGVDENVQEKRVILDIRGDEIPHWWTEQKKKPKKTRLLSISTDKLSSERWHNNMHLPKPEVLVLNFEMEEKYVLPKFVRKMSKLKVLIVTNYGFSPAELINFQLLGSLSYLKRIRLERISIPSIPNKSIFKSVKKISMFMCSISQAFSNSSIRFFQAFPSLEELNIDYCSDLGKLPVDLCDLSHLKKLSITSCHKLDALPEEIGQLVNLEVLRLRSCTNLEWLPSSTSKLTKLHSLDMQNCYSIRELPQGIGQMSGLRKINIGQCSRLEDLPESVAGLEHLEEVICNEETEHLWKLFLPSLGNKIKLAKENINLKWLHTAQL